MAIPVARVHLAMAHAALPALLPTPPKSKMLPLLPTPPPCILILPMSPPKPSRADADERWDARKAVKPASPAPSSGSSGQRTPDGKNTDRPGRASSCERWGSNKKSATSSSSSGGGISSARRASSTGEKWDSNKRRPGTGSRAERWDDAHKKPRPPQAGGGIDDEDGQSSSTGSNDMELDMPPQRAFYAGPGFLASPEPGMLPMPSSLLMHAPRFRVACVDQDSGIARVG
ncbi:hypothetical protein SETIT_7G326900v2 [Setaria italica]|uniref:Uncharacterized protein n=1 Tax=Setaria italica TaxID=4555 RepID=A0A368S2A6_SETIT|nr:hypothetical protein SETIT_7G326900v2 [Setaria italica]